MHIRRKRAKDLPTAIRSAETEILNRVFFVAKFGSLEKDGAADWAG